MNSNRIFIAAFIVICGIIVYQDIHYCSDLPWPPRFVFTALTMGMLDLATPFAPQVTALIAGGMVVGFGICTLRPTGACGNFIPSCWQMKTGTKHPKELSSDPTLVGTQTVSNQQLAANTQAMIAQQQPTPTRPGGGPPTGSVDTQRPLNLPGTPPVPPGGIGGPA